MLAEAYRISNEALKGQKAAAEALRDDLCNHAELLLLAIGHHETLITEDPHNSNTVVWDAVLDRADQVSALILPSTTVTITKLPEATTHASQP